MVDKLVQVYEFKGISTRRLVNKTLQALKLAAEGQHKFLASIRVVLAVDLQNRYAFRYLDVKTTFLNGTLEEKINLRAPDEVNVKPDKVLELRKSVYGLKQAPKCWDMRFDNCS